ncbi:MAG: rod shape-determining protein MreC [Rhodocyclaceae bacterium]|jgi:rod shape-determining protein MreC|nr:rod shape-determining protein MreC [Rhodocyclaceae bacterium]
MSLVGHPSPPVFKRGPSPLARLLMLVVVCLAMLVADLRFRYLEVARQALSVVTHPLQVAAAAPVDFARNAAVYFATLVEVQLENADLRRSQLEAAQRLLRFEQLEAENAELRRLLGMAEAVAVRSVAAEILYDAPDPFARKVILDRGAHHGVVPGLAVLDAQGMIGQVTRVYPIQSEVTLLSDKEQAVPVQVRRTGVRGVLFGNGQAPLELRFVLSGEDVQVGDVLETSGLDGVFLAGLPVAEVTALGPDEDLFMSIRSEPIGRVERAIQVLVLGRDQAAPPRPHASSALDPDSLACECPPGELEAEGEGASPESAAGAAQKTGD